MCAEVGLSGCKHVDCSDLGSPLERAILTRVQQHFPLCKRPYHELGERCGVSEDEAYNAVEAFRSQGIIRRIGASFESSRMGYVSTLAALAIAPHNIERAAHLVSAHTGVTHNYERNDRYNLWFTLIARNVKERDEELACIAAQTGCNDVLVLPTQRLFKIKVAFDVTVNEQPVATLSEEVSPVFASASLEPACVEAEPLSGDDRALIRVLQGDIGATMRPFAQAAKDVSGQVGHTLSEEWVIERTRELHTAGIIRRFGAMVRHRRMGFSSNAMAVWDVPDNQVLAAGAILATPTAVSHCYQRPRYANWPFNLYTMIHGRDRASCECVAAHLHAELACRGIDVPRPRLLLSTREFKKTSMRYFEEE